MFSSLGAQRFWAANIVLVLMASISTIYGAPVLKGEAMKDETLGNPAALVSEFDIQRLAQLRLLGLQRSPVQRVQPITEVHPDARLVIPQSFRKTDAGGPTPDSSAGSSSDGQAPAIPNGAAGAGVGVAPPAAPAQDEQQNGAVGGLPGGGAPVPSQGAAAPPASGVAAGETGGMGGGGGYGVAGAGSSTGGVVGAQAGVQDVAQPGVAGGVAGGSPDGAALGYAVAAGQGPVVGAETPPGGDGRAGGAAYGAAAYGQQDTQRGPGEPGAAGPLGSVGAGGIGAGSMDMVGGVPSSGGSAASLPLGGGGSPPMGVGAPTPVGSGAVGAPAGGFSQRPF